MDSTTIIYYVCCLLSFVPAIVFHEVAHGFAAYRLGDPTAKAAGRLTLNPLAHVDPFGSVILPLLMMIMGGPVFGYAKPVPYNPTFFKNKRTGDFIVGMAGPAANLLMALLGSGVAIALSGTVEALSMTAQPPMVLMYFYYWFLPLFIIVNLYLMFFNLIPVPPLDGSSIFALFVPKGKMHMYYKIEQYAMPVLLVLLFLVPYVTGFSPLGVDLDVTAGNIANLICPVIAF